MKQLGKTKTVPVNLSLNAEYKALAEKLAAEYDTVSTRSRKGSLSALFRLFLKTHEKFGHELRPFMSIVRKENDGIVPEIEDRR